MADKYVNKSGSDSNSGADHANAYLTIQKGIDEVGDGDVLYVGFGKYAENLTTSTAKAFNLIADFGTTVNPASGAAFDFNHTSNANINIYYLKFDADVKTLSPIDRMPSFYNCKFDTVIINRRHQDEDVEVKNSIINNIILVVQGGAASKVSFVNCTIQDEVDVSYDVGSATDKSFDFINCLFSSAKNIDNFNTNYTTRFINCCARGSFEFSGTTYADLAAAEAALPDLFQSCFNKAPHLDNNYCPEPGSPLIGNGAGGEYEDYIGARAPGVYHSANSELFAGASYSVGGWNETNQRYEPDAGESVLEVETDVQDAGASVAIGPAYKDAVEVYPTDMLRVENDTPNRLDYQMRYSDTSFAKADGSPAWSSYQWGEDPGVSGRYKQYRFYLRTDGVEQ